MAQGWDAGMWSRVASYAALMAAQAREHEVHQQVQGVALASDHATYGECGSYDSRRLVGDPEFVQEILHRSSFDSAQLGSSMNSAREDSDTRSIATSAKMDDCMSSGASRIRKQDREKKRKTRDLSNQLVKRLESLLSRSSCKRTLHEILTETINSVRNAVCARDLRSGFMTQTNLGIILVDMHLKLLDWNSIVQNLVKVPLVRGTALNSVVDDVDKDLELIMQHLSRSKFRDEYLRRFVLSMPFTYQSDEHLIRLMVEVIKCSGETLETKVEETTGNKTRGEERPDRCSRKQPRFFLYVYPTDENGCVQFALRALAGFRDGDTCVTFRQADTPIFWGSRNRSHDIGSDLPPYGAPWALEFLHRGVKEGNWGGLQEWLESRVNPTSVQQSVLSVIHLLSESTGQDDKYSLTMQIRQEPGHILCRMRLKGLCLFEFKIDSNGMYPSVPFPTHSQYSLVDGALSLEEQCLRKVAAGRKANEISVLADGSVWFSFRPSPAELLEVLQPLGGDVGAKHATLPASILPRRQVNVHIARDLDCALAMRRYKIAASEIEGSVRRWVPAERPVPEVGGIEVRNSLLNLYHEMLEEAGMCPAHPHSSQIGLTHSGAPGGQIARGYDKALEVEPGKLDVVGPEAMKEIATAAGLHEVANTDVLGSHRDDDGTGIGAVVGGGDLGAQPGIDFGTQPADNMEAWEWAPSSPFDAVFSQPFNMF